MFDFLTSILNSFFGFYVNMPVLVLFLWMLLGALGYSHIHNYYMYGYGRINVFLVVFYMIICLSIGPIAYLASGVLFKMSNIDDRSKEWAKSAKEDTTIEYDKLMKIKERLLGDDKLKHDTEILDVIDKLKDHYEITLSVAQSILDGEEKYNS